MYMHGVFYQLLYPRHLCRRVYSQLVGRSVGRIGSGRFGSVRFGSVHFSSFSKSVRGVCEICEIKVKVLVIFSLVVYIS